MRALALQLTELIGTAPMNGDAIPSWLSAAG
jgi:hypothetical protein